MSDFELLKWAVSHDPCRAGDRTPAGAVPAGTIVHLTLRVEETARSSVHAVFALWGERASGSAGVVWNEASLTPSAEGFAGFFSLDAAPHVVFYVFLIEMADGTRAYYVPRADGRATAGDLVREGVEGHWTPRGWLYESPFLEQRATGSFGLEELAPGFQVTIYEPTFATPSWMPGAIMYQIFPDRFFRGSAEANARGLAYHEYMGRPVHLHYSWDDAVEWLPEQSHPEGESIAPAERRFEDFYVRDDAQQLYYDPIDFYGGTLEGIRQKLAYIASLGVEVIYLNPIFEARSNHRYDTADYERVDPLLGDDNDFRRLVEEAETLGMKVVLDLALSHTGDDSRYFNARGTYAEPGAAQGGQSRYFSWYDFECLSGRVPYRCWWGDPSLPEVDERNESWQRYVLGEGGVLDRWLIAGAGGYRLDVADEIPDDVLERIRQRVKQVRPDAALIGEVWEDATTKESYGVPRTYALGVALDSVMNYPLRSALLGFALGSIDALQLASFLRLQQVNYPPQLHACLMNLLSSHDVERVRSALCLGQPVKHLQRSEQLDLVSSITPDQDARAARLQRMIAALLYALPGMPCIYYGDERGLQGGGDPFCRATFPWSGSEERDDCGADLTEFYQRIGMLRKGTPALRDGAFACAAPAKDVVVVLRADREGRSVLVAAANRGTQACTVAVDASSPEFGLPSGIRWAARRIDARCAQVVLEANEAEAQASFDCEDGVVRLGIPPETTVFWAASTLE